MNKTKNLLDRYLNDTCTEAERQQVDNWLTTYNRTDDEWKIMNAPQKQEWLNSLFVDIDQATKYQQLNKPIAIKYKFTRNRFFAIAASIVLIFSSGLLLFKYHYKSTSTLAFAKNDIAPGRNKAILTLANGSKINLSDAKTGVIINSDMLTYNDGSTVSSPSVTITEQLAIHTPRGGTYQIVLNDGTKVWLNAASSLKFPSNFNGIAHRKVILSGEAYFEVAKDQKHPFVVQTDKQEVRVLGTHFNINSYPDETSTKTTLLEGIVKITSIISQRAIQLAPNQQSDLTDNDIKVQTANAKEIMAWKNGQFIFNDENLGSIMRKLSRWYNVDINFQDQVQNVSFIGVVSRAKNISSVLQLLEETGNVKFKIEGRRITVMK